MCKNVDAPTVTRRSSGDPVEPVVHQGPEECRLVELRVAPGDVDHRER
jgi:hypothetical protein